MTYSILMKKILFLLIPFLILSCKKNENIPGVQLENKLVSEKEIYEVLISVLGTTSKDRLMSTNYITEDISMKFIEVEPAFLGERSLDTFFTPKDIDFIKKQIKTINNFKLKQELLEGKIVIPSDTLAKFQTNKNGKGTFWDNYTRKYGNNCFYSISLPLFSLDRKTVITISSINCGSLGGGGATEVYRKTNGKWMLIATLSNWGS